MCPDKSLLSAFYDGELASGQRDRVESHLAVCESCRRTYEGFTRLSTMLHEHSEPEVHSSFGDLQKMIRHKKNVDKVRVIPGSFSRFILPGAAAAAAVIAFLAGFTAGTPASSSARGADFPAALSRTWSAPPGDLLVPGEDLNAVLSRISRNGGALFNQEAALELPGDLDLAMLGDSQLVPAAKIKASSVK